MTELARGAFKAQMEQAPQSEYLFPSPSKRAKRPYITSLRRIWERPWCELVSRTFLCTTCGTLSQRGLARGA